MKVPNIYRAAVAAAALGSRLFDDGPAVADAEGAQEERSADDTAVVAAEAVGLRCPLDVPCKLEMGTAFGDPWLKAEEGEIGYFEVIGFEAADT